MGLISAIWRTITSPVKEGLKKVKERFRRKKPSKKETVIPATWQKKKLEEAGPGSRAVKKEIVIKHEGKLKRIYHFPWLLRFKRALAGILLLVNLGFSQFILGSQNEGQIFFLLFLFNAFILTDYLWKTRRKPE